jgi:hypothetical protein
MRDPKERLQDILEAIAAIERYADRHRAASYRTSCSRTGLSATGTPFAAIVHPRPQEARDRHV